MFLISYEPNYSSYSYSYNTLNYVLLQEPHKKPQIILCYIKLPDGSGSLITIGNHNILESRPGSGSVPQIILIKNSDQALPSSGEKAISTTITSMKDQIEYLRWDLGLNISEIASILRVKRPTVYEWLEEKTRRPRKQERLEIIHTICKKWKQFGVGRVGSYLYKKIDNSRNLFDLLNDDDLDKTLIAEVLSKIKDDFTRRQNEKKQHEEELKKAGFSPVSTNRKEIKKWIDRTIRTIG